MNQNRCAEVIFDRQGNERRLNGSRAMPIEEKSYQMFGATVITTKAGGTVLVSVYFELMDRVQYI